MEKEEKVVRKGKSLKKPSKRFWGLLGIGGFGLILVLILAGVLLVFLVGGALLFYDEISPKIGIINIHGRISSNDFGVGVANSREIVSLIKDAEDDPSVKVIFLDIDSGGGEVVASKEIAYKVRNCSKPVVAYIGSIGASGAYYIASASDIVIADEDSLTGSIGVIMILENFHGLLQKIGVNMTTLKKGKYKDIANPYRNVTLTPEERAVMEDMLETAYSHFKRDLLEFRGDKLNASIDEIADGRPMTGEEAWKLGLVDELGTREYALKRAWELAGEEGEPEVKEFKSARINILDLFSDFGYAFMGGALASLEGADKKIGSNQKMSSIYYSSSA